MALQLSFFLLLFQVRVFLTAIPSAACSSLPCFPSGLVGTVSNLIMLCEKTSLLSGS